MKKDLLLSHSKSLCILLILFFFYQNTSAQCVTGNTSQSFCDIDSSTVSDLVVTGINVVWFDAPTGGNQYNPTDPLIDGVIYYALDIDPSCVDPTRLPVTVSIDGEPPTNVNVFVGVCAIDNPTIADLSATGTNIEWYDAQTGGNLLASTDPLANSVYWVQQTVNGCTSSRLPTAVTIIDPPAPVVTTNQSFCFPPNPTVADLNASGSDILWYDSETSTVPLNSTDLLIDGEDYWATQTVFPCESTSKSQVIVTLDPAPDAGTPGSIDFCEGDSGTENLFDQLGGTPEITGVWSGPSVLSGGYLGTFDPATNIAGNYTYTVSSTGSSGACPDAMADVTVIITVVPPPTVAETTQTFCFDDFAPAVPTVGDLTATGADINWYDTETSSTPLNASDPLVNGEDYWASETDASSGCESATRTVVTAILINPPPPTISETNQIFCTIDYTPNNPTVGDLAATGNDVQWYDSEFDTTALDPTTDLIDGEDYWAADLDPTTGCESVPRIVVTVSIIDPPPPTVANTTQTFCSVDFSPNNPTVSDLSATGMNVQWYATETETTPLDPTTDLIDGEDYWASDTDTASGCESTVRTVVTVSIIDPPPPTVSDTTQTFCADDFNPDVPTVGDLSVTGNNISWYATETDTTPLDSNDPLIDGEDYWAADTDTASGCESSVRTVVTVVIVNPPPPTISETNQVFCLDDFAPNLPTINDLIATGNDVQWYAGEFDSTALDPTTELIDGEDYWAADVDSTTGCESIPRIMVTVTFTDPLPPTTSETTQTFCTVDYPPSGPTVADLNATGNMIVWYDSETSTTALNDTDLLVDGEDYWAAEMETTTGCESSIRLMVTALVINPPPPTTSEANQIFCSIDYPSGATVGDLSATGNNISWYDSETSTTPLNDTDLLIDGEDYWASETDTTTGCESAVRLVVTASLIDPAPPTISDVNQSFCAADNPTVANLSATGDTIQWYDSETSTTPLDSSEMLIDGEDYWSSNIDSTTGCESNTRIEVTVTINDVLPPVISELTQTFCASDSPTVNDLNSDGNDVLWYDSETSTTPLNDNDLLVDSQSYWAAQQDTTTSCESSVREVVNVVLTDPAAPTIDLDDTIFCEIENPNPTIGDLNDNLITNGGTITWFDDYPNGNVLNLDYIVMDNETYYAVETDGDGCTSTIPLTVTVTFECDPDEYDIEIYDGFSPNNDGRNDTFVIKDLRTLYPDFEIEIYNRWGQIVFRGNTSRSDWNGEKDGNGELLPAGVYYFILHFNKDGRESEQHRLYLSR